MTFSVRTKTFYTNGVASSSVYTNDCKYMKIDLTGVVSSNHIFISGTNDGGSTWKTLTDGSWIDFGSESSAGTQIKYKLSGNGKFTPKIDYATLTISDESGGFEQTVYTDDFSDTSYLSSNSLNNLNLSESWMNNWDSNIPTNSLLISGIVAINPDSSNDTITNDSDWQNDPSNMLDGDFDTYARYYDSAGETFYDECIFGGGRGPYTVIGMKSKYRGTYEIDRWRLVGFRYMYLTKNGSTWLEVASGRDGDRGTLIDYWDMYENNHMYISGITGFKGRTSCNTQTINKGHLLGYNIELYTIPNEGLSNGNAKSINFDLGALTYYYIKLDVTESYGEYITYSGSLDGGTNWDKLTKNESTLISNPGSNLVIMYNIQPSGTFGNTSGNVLIPSIDSVTCTVETTQGGGIPKSGSKIEWSDDLSWSAGDIPYPPNYSGWKSYTSPKLSGLTFNNDYWMVFEYPSGSSKYWNYYYDSSSTYDGKLAYSTDDGVTWNSHSTDSSVPDGNMRFKLGWSEGQIRARALNQTSIDIYGRHFKKVSESSYNQSSQAYVRAQLEVSGMTTIPKKGNVTIEGITNIDTDYRFSSNLTNFGIDEIWNVAQYTQTIDKNGFTTTIQYNKHDFDIAKEVAQLKQKVNE